MMDLEKEISIFEGMSVEFSFSNGIVTLRRGIVDYRIPILPSM